MKKYYIFLVANCDTIFWNSYKKNVYNTELYKDTDFKHYRDQLNFINRYQKI